MDTPSMNPLVRDTWIEMALSETYKQGRLWLCKITPAGEEYCFNGLLVLAAHRAGIVKTTEITIPDIGVTVVRFGAEYGHVPMVVRKWAGLDKAGPLINLGPQFVTDNPKLKNSGNLAMLNDEGASFSELADYIKAYL